MDDDLDSVNPTSIAEEGWKSASAMRREGLGGVYVLTRELLALRDELIQKQVDGGRTQEAAQAFVDQHQIGVRRPGLHGPSALHASPDVWDILTKRITPVAENGWRSPQDIFDDGYRSGRTPIVSKLRHYHDEQVKNLVAQNYSNDVASSLVSDHLIGKRRSPKGKGVATHYASPDAVNLMEREKLLTRNCRDLKATNSYVVSSDPIARLLVEATQQLERRNGREDAQKFYQLIVSSFPDTTEAAYARSKIRSVTQEFER